MYTNLEFRGRWLDIFGNVLLIAILTTITLGIYAPWGYARWKRIITENTYFEEQPLEFDGTGGQAFVQFLIVGVLSLITLGLYVILGFAGVRLLQWEYAHTIMPNGQRMEYRGSAIDLFFEYFLLVLFSSLTLGIFYFWGYTRVRRHIITNTYLDGQPLRFEGAGSSFFLLVLVNWLLSIITVGFYAILGFATVRLLKWDVGNTLVPLPLRSPRPMPVVSPPLSALTGGFPEPAQEQPGEPETQYDESAFYSAAEGSTRPTGTESLYDYEGLEHAASSAEEFQSYSDYSMAEPTSDQPFQPDWSDVQPYRPDLSSGPEHPSDTPADEDDSRTE